MGNDDFCLIQPDVSELVELRVLTQDSPQSLAGESQF